jgi:spermidine synthase
VAVLFFEQRGAQRVEVRSAGNTRRLYVDGVLHTQYNPTHALTGDIWDPLALAARLAPRGALRRVLLLGLGGGAVVQLMQRFLPPIETFVAVEIDALKVELARRYFGLDDIAGLQVVVDDARAFLRRYRGRPFDLIIDDLFLEQDGQPERALAINDSWTGLLSKRLAQPGWLIVNFPAYSEFKTSALNAPTMRERFVRAFRFSTPQSENAIVALCGQDTCKKTFRRRLLVDPQLSRAKERSRLRFRSYRVW